MKYASCSLLMQDLLVAKRDLRLSKEIKKLARDDGLMIDERAASSKVAKRWRYCEKDLPTPIGKYGCR